MKRVLALPAVTLLLGSVACSSPEVAVEAAMTQGATGETIALQDLPIRLLPYDRDAIFDSLTAEAETPEPEIPAALQQQRNEVIAAQDDAKPLQQRSCANGQGLGQLRHRTLRRSADIGDGPIGRPARLRLY